MRESNSLYATLVIWIAFAVMTIVLFTLPGSVFKDASPGILLVVLGILATAATTGTMAAWGALEGQSTSEAERASRLAKDKHTPRNRMSRLVEDLEDDEIYELEALLIARDEQLERQHHP